MNKATQLQLGLLKAAKGILPHVAGDTLLRGGLGGAGGGGLGVILGGISAKDQSDILDNAQEGAIGLGSTGVGMGVGLAAGDAPAWHAASRLSSVSEKMQAAGKPTKSLIKIFNKIKDLSLKGRWIGGTVGGLAGLGTGLAINHQMNKGPLDNLKDKLGI